MNLINLEDNFILFIPVITFLALLVGEAFLKPPANEKQYAWGDWVIVLTGFLSQGLVIPALGVWIGTEVLPAFFPAFSGIIPLGWWAAFAVSFIGIDFVYYWQHRAFHGMSALWNFHICHHSSPKLDVWATSRNSLITNFMFVYLFLSPPLAFLCQQPEAILFAAMLTASLDLLKHTRIDLYQVPGVKECLPLLSKIFVMPREHHRHHLATDNRVNYGAVFILWDRLFGTVSYGDAYPEDYQVDKESSPAQQLLYPFFRRKT